MYTNCSRTSPNGPPLPVGRGGRHLFEEGERLQRPRDVEVVLGERQGGLLLPVGRVRPFEPAQEAPLDLPLPGLLAGPPVARRPSRPIRLLGPHSSYHP